MAKDVSSKALLAIGGALEAIMGVALVIEPALVVRWLLGAEISDAGLALGRVGGFGLLSLGIACWPRTGPTAPGLLALLTYNLLAAAYLAYLRIDGELIGRLLAPGIAIHTVLALLFARALFDHPRTRTGGNPPQPRS